jgi:hypothetical protein
MQKLNKDTFTSGVGFPSLPSMTTPNPLISNYPQTGGIPTTQSNCLLLSNLFDPTLVNLKEDPNFYNDTRDDVYSECSKNGKIEKIWLDENSAGNIWIKFANNNYQAAKNTYDKLNGRY